MQRRISIVSLAALALVLLFLWNSSVPEGKPIEQARFERWLAVRQSPENRTKHAKLPPVEIEISAWATAERKVSYRFSSSEGQTPVDKITRLLSLMQEAAVFSRHDETRDDSPGISIKVQSKDYLFETSLRRQNAEKNLQLDTLLKLAQIYAQPRSVQ